MTMATVAVKNYLVAEVTEELLRDLVGRNMVVLRKAFSHRCRLAPTTYYFSLAEAKNFIRDHIHDLDTKEFWIGCQRVLEPELTAFLQQDRFVDMYKKKRKNGVNSVCSPNAVLYHFTFE